MSSMFKKKTGLAFKPKIPSAVSRPTPAAQIPPPPPTSSSEAPRNNKPEDNILEHNRNQAATDADVITGEALEASQPSTPTVIEKSSNLQPSTLPPTVEPVPNKQRSTPSIDVPAATQANSPQPLAVCAETAVPQVRAPSEVRPASTSAEQAVTTGDEDFSEALQAQETLSTSVVTEQISTKATRRRVPRSTRSAPAVKFSATSEAERPQTRKRQRKAPSASSSASSEAEEDGEASAKPKRRRAAISSSAKSRRARSPTPEGAESQRVDLATLKMSDLTEDLRIGKKFSRHDELRERERKRRVSTRLVKARLADEKEGDEQGNSNDREEATGSQGEETQENNGAGSSGPQFRIVDGQIIVDQSSLVMDRHARAAANQGNMETVEENDFTRLITSSSFSTNSKLRGPNIWSETETELFYRALRMFGTDFEMMSRMFAGKKRRHVKLKFNREERHNPHLVNAALIGEKTVKMDIEEYKALTGTELESVESIEAEQRRIQESYEAEQKRIADGQAEIMRKKREELFAEDEDDGNEKKGKKRGKKKKQIVEYGLNGEPVRREQAA